MGILRRNPNELSDNDRLCHEVCKFQNGWEMCPCSKAGSRPCAKIEGQVSYIANKVREMDKAAAKVARALRKTARASLKQQAPE